MNGKFKGARGTALVELAVRFVLSGYMSKSERNELAKRVAAIVRPFIQAKP